MDDLNTKKSPAISIIAIVIVALLLGVGAYMFTKKSLDTAPVPVETTQTDETAPPAETATTPPAGEAAPVVVETKKLEIPAADTPPPSATNSDPAIAAMMAPRTLGLETAPVKIIEYSSLTCSHCGTFHRETFEKFKSEFIDTGKVQITFKEFPLNQPAMDASQILRCLPEDKFVSFMNVLFQEQDKWAFDANYKESLRQNAKLAGMSDETFDACLANDALKQAILGDMKAAGDQYKVQSTPSFVFNNGAKTLVGNQPVEEFAKAIAEVSAAPVSAPAATTETAPEAAADAAVKATTPPATEEQTPPAE